MAERRVLELRIHGINNTTPANMLDLSESSIEKTEGDALGSFWRPTPEGRAKLPPTKPGTLDESIELEAYSWGGMARSSVGGSSGPGLIVRGAARVGWALLLPFGLVNVAYWTRRFDDGPPPKTGKAQSARGGPGSWRGAASLRLAGLLLTLLMAVTAAVIVLDLVAVQCYRGDKLICTNIPSQLGFLATLEQTQRIAVLSFVPVLLVVLLATLSAMTRLRYEQPDPDPKGGQPEASTVDPDWPVLSTPGFWAHRTITKTTSRLHVAATASLISTITAWHVTFGSAGEVCDTRDEVLRDACRAQVWAAGTRSRLELAIIAVGILLLGLIAWAIAARSDDAGDVVSNTDEDSLSRRVWTSWLPVGGSFLLFVVQLLILFKAPQPQPIETHLLGMSAVTALLLAAVLGLALSGCIWRSCSRERTLWRFVPMLCAVLFAMFIAISGFPIVRWWAISGAVLIAVLVVTVALKHRKRNEFEAWGGAAPGAILFVAAALAMLLSSAVAVASGDWLNGGNGAAALADRGGGWKEIAPCPYSCGEATILPALQLPLPYLWFGAMLLILIPLLGGVAGLGFWRSMTWQGLPDAGGVGQAAADATSPPLHARRLAAFAHRAEPIAGVLAALSASALVIAVTIAVTNPTPNSWLRWGLNAGLWLLAGSGIVVIGLAVGGSIMGGARPLGLVWDLICFLPRTGHPLAPPCYAERVVPELAQRCKVWLDEPDDNRTIVLSAHSLGAVLAVGCTLSARITIGDADRLSLLTYGTQLRPYFGRIFPELLGPTVLATPGCRSSRLLTPDPWEKELQGPQPPVVDHPRSLRARLGDIDRRWRSLWRRTDYLGFPVWGYAENSIDGTAPEVLTVGYLNEIQSHGGYTRTLAYQAALRSLLGVTRTSAPDVDTET